MSNVRLEVYADLVRFYHRRGQGTRAEAVSIPQVGLGFTTFGYRRGFNRLRRNRSPISNLFYIVLYTGCSNSKNIEERVPILGFSINERSLKPAAPTNSKCVKQSNRFHIFAYYDVHFFF